MMKNSRIEDLIEELRTLKIRETEIVAELKQATNTTTEEQDKGKNERNATPVAIAKGDRVRIVNKVRRPASAGPTWTEANERLAVVTSVNATQVHILTDNGTRTWRGPNNLRLLQK